MDLLLLTSHVVTTLSVLTVVGQLISLAIIVLLLCDCFFSHKYILRNKKLVWNVCAAMFLVALISTAGSLFFSEIVEWLPCKECWFQRIFMYPQVLILGLALWKKDWHIAPYILLLCLFGIPISLHHYLEQMSLLLGPVATDSAYSCDASGASCASTYIFEFGYITIPLMAFTGFVMNALGSLLLMRATAKK